MNKQYADKWVEALRSGKYQQTTRVLRRGDSFCCLGVLCDVVDPTKWKKWESFSTHTDNSIGYLPEPLMKEVQIKSIGGSLPEIVTFNKSHAAGSLTAMNDNGASFQQIADAIEKYWEQL